MDPFHHLNTSFSNPFHPLLPPPPPPPPPQPPTAEPPFDRDRERLPQWSHAETARFLSIRAELDHSFLSTKRNKPLWEAVSSRLLAAGFSRTPDQCKSKWKNLVTRFKGSEAVPEQDAGRQFPFQEEMRRIFAARMERVRALEKKAAKGKEVQVEDDDGDGGEEEEEEEEGGDEEEKVVKKRRRKVAAAKRTVEGEVEAMLREFMRRQLEMEERWMEATEAREAERRAREEEWRQEMVALGEERLALVRRWREREEAWRARAEAREERRHQLVAALLAKLGAGAGDG